MSQRTSNQNRALHKYLELVAEELDREGHSMQHVLTHVTKVDVRPTAHALKEVIWKPIQKLLYDKESTAELTTAEVDRVYEVMNKWLGENFTIHIPFPSDETRDV